MMQPKHETDDKDAAAAKQTVKAIPSDLSRTAFIVGVVCWIIALISAVFAAILVIIMVEKGSFDCALFARLGLFVIFALLFVAMGLRCFLRQPVNAARSSAAISPKYNKYNDPAWCMGVLGIVGGVLCLLLAMREVIEVFRNHTFVFYSFGMLLAGLYFYLRWRRRTRCAACFESSNEPCHRFATLLLYMAVMDRTDRILFGQPSKPFILRQSKSKTQDEKEIIQTQEASTLSESLTEKGMPVWFRAEGEWEEHVPLVIRLLPAVLAEFFDHANEGICIDVKPPLKVKYSVGMTEDFHYFVDIIGTEGIA